MADAERGRHDSTDTVLCALADTLAVSFAGRDEPVVNRTLQYLRAGHQNGKVPCWIADDHFAPEGAALINGVAAHALDYDDVTPAWRGHPSAVFFPALLSLADDVLSGSDLIDAYSIGFEVSRWLGRACAQSQYQRGWHTTATIGVVGAAAACARLLRLDASQVSAALGLAVAQAAGPQANFGTMAKPLHAGFAAAAAVRAACLAKSGVDASDHAVDGPRGFLHLYGVDPSGVLRESPGDDGAQPNHNSLLPKSFPNCFATHYALSGLLRLRSKHSFAADHVTSVSIEGNEGSHAALVKTLPRDEVAAKFSLEYATALVLLDGFVGLNSFSPETFSRGDVQALMKRVSVSETAGTGPVRVSRVQVMLDDGQRHETLVEGVEPVSRDMLVMKIGDCLSFAGARVNADDFCAEVLGIADRPVTALFSAIQGVRRSMHARGDEKLHKVLA